MFKRRSKINRTRNCRTNILHNNYHNTIDPGRTVFFSVPIQVLCFLVNVVFDELAVVSVKFGLFCQIDYYN